MGIERRVFRVEEIAENMGDAPFGSLLKNSDYTESGALVVQGKNIQGRTCDWSDRRFVSHEKYKTLQRSHCFPGDLIFPKVGTLGK
jgi:type I restriction enzyme S subunit